MTIQSNTNRANQLDVFEKIDEAVSTLNNVTIITNTLDSTDQFFASESATHIYAYTEAHTALERHTFL